MFFVTAVGRIQPYVRGQEWRRPKEAYDPEDKEGKKEHHPQDDRKKESINLLDYIKPLKESKHKIRATVIARSVMSSPVITLSDKLSIEDAKEIFLKHRFANIPVISGKGELRGIVSAHDLYREKSKDKKVEDVMTEEVLCADADTEIDSIAHLFFNENIRILPIIDKEKHVIGILTRNDILRTVFKIANLGTLGQS